MSENEIIHSQYLSLYKWLFSQDDDNVFIKFKMPQADKFDSSDIHVELTEKQTIKVFITGKIPFLYGTLFEEVDENYTQRVSSNYFIITLKKTQPIEWKCLIKSVTKDKLKADPKSCFLLGINQIDEFSKEMLTPLLALSVQYHYPEACLYLGNKYLKEKNYKDALESYQLIANDHNYPTAALQAGIVLFKLGKIDEAKEYLNRASEFGIEAANNVLNEIDETKKEAKTIIASEIQAVQTMTAATEAAAEAISIEKSKENAAAQKIAANVIAAAIEESILQEVATSVAAATESAIIAENIVAREAALDGTVETTLAAEDAIARTVAANEAIDTIASVDQAAVNTMAEAADTLADTATSVVVAAETTLTAESVAVEESATVGEAAERIIATETTVPHNYHENNNNTQSTAIIPKTEQKSNFFSSPAALVVMAVGIVSLLLLTQIRKRRR